MHFFDTWHQAWLHLQRRGYRIFLPVHEFLLCDLRVRVSLGWLKYFLENGHRIPDVKVAVFLKDPDL